MHEKKGVYVVSKSFMQYLIAKKILYLNNKYVHEHVHGAKNEFHLGQKLSCIKSVLIAEFILCANIGGYALSHLPHLYF